jgi:2-polyprenyl-3-methyl-5-hydroxy-6-metoxy-1,4-benzoquinol methylase
VRKPTSKSKCGFDRNAGLCKTANKAVRGVTKVDVEYFFGHENEEIERLKLQATIIGGVTRRLIQDCGIRSGMRVLEFGCGVGDVSMLLAEAVGPTGAVVAIDREVRAIETAKRRAEKSGFQQIDFVLTSDEELPDRPAYDAAFGRYVLIHQPDPTLMVRRAADAVKPGGPVAFQEPALHVLCGALPTIDLFDAVAECIVTASRALLPNYDVGGRLVACFEDAGLPGANLVWECVAGGPSSSLMEWAATTYRAYLPYGLGRSDIGDPDTLHERLAAAATAVRAQIISMPQSCAWATRPFDDDQYCGRMT